MNFLNFFFTKLFALDYPTNSTLLQGQGVNSNRSIYPSRFVFNVLTVTGPQFDLNRFKPLCQGFDSLTDGRIGNFNHFSFEVIITLGSVQGLNIFELEDLRERLWGCPSFAHGVSFTESKNQLRYAFTTFESEPSKIIEKLRREFPELTMRYDAKYQ